MKNQISLDEATLCAMLRADFLRAVQEAPSQHSQRTPNCPHLPRFGEALDRDDWTAEERRHVYESGCVYCGKVLRMFERAANEEYDGRSRLR
jgi:hypothetical protein